MLLEIAVFNVHSAILAEKAGADRLELCENPEEGGTTPSYGTLRTVIEKVGIPAFPIIRPRGGDFLYDEDSYEVMKKDLLLCKELGFTGAVLGLLDKDGSIDKERTRRLVELSYPLEITFHRAFDRAKAPLEALNDLIDCGCNRVLTSGQHPTVAGGMALISELIRMAGNDIIILPGSGVRSTTLPQLIAAGAEEFHSSARMVVPSAMEYTVPEMNERLDNLIVDTGEIHAMKALLSK
ncbi:copper homeostasis protein CutC [Arachidicoccus terrestris]|uniref:copper homeostasis protein CutC n=1 Tax=Arachidicoccus terrestris TaxID=2875539 RepID=UPI001CC73BAE|nr:copper homeostasis protein CutC [Arachidicoccus terrestris]UAY56853.1 copper homeostasis protein CutC [Arachidicoccus terrestris]